MPVLAYIAIVIVAAIVAYALAPHASIPKPATLQDFDFPQADEGTPQIVVFGDVWITGWMVLTYGNLSTSKITQDTGGK